MARGGGGATLGHKRATPMKTMFSKLCWLLLGCCTSLAQGIFEAPLSVGLGGSASLIAGIGYFRVAGVSVDYCLAFYDLSASSLSPVIATTSFESTFTTGIGEVITVTGCELLPPNPYLPSRPPGPITCPALIDWAWYSGSFTLPGGQAAELFSGGGILRVPSGLGEAYGVLAAVPEPHSVILLACGLVGVSWRFARAKLAQSGRRED